MTGGQPVTPEAIDRELAEREADEALFRIAGYAAGQQNPHEVMDDLAEVLFGAPVDRAQARSALRRHRGCMLCQLPGTSGRPLITTPDGWRPGRPRMHQECYERLRDQPPLDGPPAPSPHWNADRVMDAIITRTPRAGLVSANRMRETLPEEAWPYLNVAIKRMRPMLVAEGWEKSAVPAHRSRKLRTYRLRER